MVFRRGAISRNTGTLSHVTRSHDEQLARLRTLIDPGQWGISDLASLAAELLGETGGSRVTSDRTIRYYASRGVITSAIGRGASARWDYRHLIELLAARMAVSTGDSLDGIAARRGRMGFPELELWVAGRLEPPRTTEALPVMPTHEVRLCFRIADGIEVSIDSSHPIAADPAKVEALIATLTRAVGTATENQE
jgi:hypothetical protein